MGYELETDLVPPYKKGNASVSWPLKFLGTFLSFLLKISLDQVVLSFEGFGIVMKVVFHFWGRNLKKSFSPKRMTRVSPASLQSRFDNLFVEVKDFLLYHHKYMYLCSDD